MANSPVVNASPAKISTSLICVWTRVRVGGPLECRWMQSAPTAVCEAPRGVAAAA